LGDIVIQIDGLSKSFRNTTAVSGVELNVMRGEMFGLVGPDGAGKTTTMRMLCGIIEPDSGSGRILGFDLWTESKDIQRRIGYLSQRFSLYGDLTVNENIEFFAEIRQIADFGKRRDQLLKFTRLSPFRDRLADNLSGGMRKKLALACTLIHTPEIVFLDEPTVGVDPVSRREFWLILAELQRQGTTIFMTTPYLDEAERCTRVALMNDGGIMICDTPAALRNSMRGSVVELVASDTRKAHAVLRNLSHARELQAFGDRINIVVDDADSAVRQIEDSLERADIGIESLRTVSPSIENVFISMIRPV
jgi:ABC-2 type transport system ATP-binding protein